MSRARKVFFGRGEHMEVTVLAVLLALAVLSSVFLGWQAVSARSLTSVTQHELENVRRQFDAADALAKKNGDILEKKRKEAEELKAQLKESKKRRHEEREAARHKKDLREAREQIAREMEKEIERAREDAEISKAQLRKLTLELEDLKKHRLEQQVAENTPKKDEAHRKEFRPAKPEEIVRAEKAERALSQARKRIQELEADIKKARGRLETDRRVFLVQKGEIDLSKDKYRSLEARHNSLILERDDLKKELWLLQNKQKETVNSQKQNLRVEQSNSNAKEIFEPAASSRDLVSQKNCPG